MCLGGMHHARRVKVCMEGLPSVAGLILRMDCLPYVVGVSADTELR